MDELERQLRDSLDLCHGCRWQSWPEAPAAPVCQNARSPNYARRCNLVTICRERTLHDNLRDAGTRETSQ